MSAVHSNELSLPPAAPPRRKDCPHCGANCWEDDESCWHCHRNLASPPAKPRFIQFSMGTILLVMTAFAVALGTLRQIPFVTLVMLVWFLPALLHTYLACRILRKRVPPVSFGERIDRFGMALVYVIPALIAAAVAGIAPACALVWIIASIVPQVTSQLLSGVFIALTILTAAVGGTAGAGLVFWFTLPRPPKEPG